MGRDEARITAARREPSFGRVFAAVWGGILFTVLLIALTGGGSTWWVVPETIAVVVAVGVILFELNLLLNDQENDEDQAPATAMAPTVASPGAAVPAVTFGAADPRDAAPSPRAVRPRPAH